VPRVLRIELEGVLPAGVAAKDIVLHLLQLPAAERPAAASARCSSSAGRWRAPCSIDERATLTNMTAELGGLTGIVEPDAETVRFLKERRGVDFALADWMRSDPGATYSEVLRVDCSALSPMVARPGDPGRGVPLAQLGEQVRVDIAYGGSCTAGKREDFDQYHAVLAWGLAHGRKVAPHVQLYLQYGRRPCATTAWPAATTAPSRRPAPASCSRPAAPAPIAGRVRPRTPAR
jgi:3-isopropylmalate/(R)-2-methylmalate dehydratase large subunit